MPDRLIVDNVVTFLMAGHETIAQALTWTLYLLALFPEWQERAREEVLKVTGGAPITSEHVQQLSLLEAISQEAMRLYPPAPSDAAGQCAFRAPGGRGAGTLRTRDAPSQRRAQAQSHNARLAVR